MQMESQEQPRSNANLLWYRIIRPLIILGIALFLSKVFFGDFFGTKAIDAAEKYVNQQVYESLGLPCDRYTSEPIYKDGDVRLIAVKFYLEGGSSASGSYCVYCKNGYAIGCTGMMGADYPYEENLEALQALFGI